MDKAEVGSRFQGGDDLLGCMCAPSPPSVTEHNNVGFKYLCSDLTLTYLDVERADVKRLALITVTFYPAAYFPPLSAGSAGVSVCLLDAPQSNL